MGAPAHARSEDARLEAVRSLGLLDSDAGPEVGDIAALAVDLFGVPIALVSLMDKERQWFIARRGVERCEAPRKLALCNHVVAASEPLVIPDARRDSRFMHNPYVLGAPYVRFYAGVPLTSDEGLCLGTLCIIDSAPRAEFTIEERAKLDRLARLAAQALRARAAHQRAQTASEAQLRAETRLRGVIDEACEAFLACDRIAHGLDRRMRPALARACAHLEGEAGDEIAGLCDYAGDMLRLARLQGQASAGARTFEPSRLVRDAAASLHLTAAKRGVTLRIEDQTAGYEILGDALIFDELLDLLLSDLVSHSEDAPLIVSTQFDLSQPSRPSLQIEAHLDAAWEVNPAPWRLSRQCSDLIENLSAACLIAPHTRRLSLYLPARLRAQVRPRANAHSNVVVYPFGANCI